MSDFQPQAHDADRPGPEGPALSKRTIPDAQERIDWSHLGVLPAHKESRRKRYMRARRRGLGKGKH